MKLSTALILASATSAVSATTIRSASVKAALLNKSRRLEENANEDLYAFLSSYSLKLVGCANGQQSTDANGGVEYSTVVYRLCPADSCDDSSSSGCKKGFGDFAVGLNTFVQAWLEDKRESMQQDDMFKVEEFGECREYKVDNDAEDEDENQYFVGPTCGGDKTATVKLGLFTDETCTTVASKTFEEISNGWSLPYSESGLVTNACESCTQTNDNGETIVSDMCTNLFDAAGKCMSGMETLNSYGADDSACSFIQSIAPTSSKSSNAGAAVGWTVFALVIVGAAAYGYTKWWIKKKQGSTLASDGAL